MGILSSLTSSPLLNTSHNERFKKILPLFEKQIIQEMEGAGIPGVAVAIASREQVHYIKTFGVKRKGNEEQITSMTQFQIASISKPLSATLLAIWQEKGKLSFEDPIHAYLPGFTNYQDKKPIKLSHILSHSSGIPKDGANDLIEASIPRDEILRRVQATPVLAGPGVTFSYHNALYGGVIENLVLKMTGNLFGQVLAENLLHPLGMKNTTVGLEALKKSKDRACPHVLNKKKQFVPCKSYSRKYYIFPSAAGVNSCLQDLILFLQLYLGKFPNIISEQSLQQLTRPYVKDTEALSWFEDKKGLIKDPLVGLGWKLMTYANRKVCYHGGWLKGFRTFLGFLPNENIGIIVLTNAESLYPEKVALEFFDFYA